MANKVTPNQIINDARSTLSSFSAWAGYVYCPVHNNYQIMNQVIMLLCDMNKKSNLPKQSNEKQLVKSKLTSLKYVYLCRRIYTEFVLAPFLFFLPQFSHFLSSSCLRILFKFKPWLVVDSFPLPLPLPNRFYFSYLRTLLHCSHLKQDLW